MISLKKYSQAFLKLRVDKAHGPAPHKPILLLSVLQVIKSGGLTENKIFITPELVALFNANWSIYASSKSRRSFALPFYYLQSDRFWKLIPKTGMEKLHDKNIPLRSFVHLNAVIDHATLDDDLFKLMINPDHNIFPQLTIRKHYFPDVSKESVSAYNIQHSLFDEFRDKFLHESSAAYKKETLELINIGDQEKIFLRSSTFQREIPRIYNNSCCVSEMRIDATSNVSMIDACHIVPFSESHDDTIGNGIALCPNLHRAFDRGLLSIDNDYRVIVKHGFIENELSNYSVKAFHGKQIVLPSNTNYFPLRENLLLHRKKFGFQ